ncbi:methyltransferase domain-containing protein [Streptomyces sp. SID3343]|nr:class I SAM-dependent methyltransferase [Streptomyces sp. SID3343]MYW05199.1 methyltransferase domain-containing protein [Streptomyces sp. SID3343]
MYGAAADPWRLAERAYDRRKYALTVASLPRARYRDAFEPACSVGVLTRLLADRCDRLLACDLSDVAVTEARGRTADVSHVRVERRVLPQEWPDRPAGFDLVVLSEFLYYFDPPTLDVVLARARACLAPGGTVVAVHWRPPAPGHVGSAEHVHEAVGAMPDLVRVVEHREPDFLLDVLIDTRGQTGAVSAADLSPAAYEGLR